MASIFDFKRFARHAAVFEGKDLATKHYSGTDRRRAHRRGLRDRRTSMRFNLQRPQRRSGEGRRTDDEHLYL